jgi:predicted metal-dependent hydrolase
MRRRIVQLDLPLAPAARDSSARLSVVLDGHVVDYVLRRSPRRRSIALTIDESGLRIGAPLAAPQSDVDDVLRRHGQWVLRKLREWSTRRPAAVEWGDGARFFLRGEPVRIVTAPRRGIVYAPHLGELHVGTVPASRSLGDALREWLRREAIATFEPRCAAMAAALGLDAPRVRLSNARTRWGSCSSLSGIRINWRLIQVPDRWIDYVVAHEVSHLVVMNHSARFWGTVAQLVPDHAERRAALRRDSPGFLLI